MQDGRFPLDRFPKFGLGNELVVPLGENLGVFRLFEGDGAVKQAAAKELIGSRGHSTPVDRSALLDLNGKVEKGSEGRREGIFVVIGQKELVQVEAERAIQILIEAAIGEFERLRNGERSAGKGACSEERSSG